MMSLGLGDPARLKRLLCIGAHCDDIEIGCGGTILTLLASCPQLEVDWIVFSSDPVRRAEASASARDFLGDAPNRRVRILEFRNGYFPTVAGDIKDFFESLKREVAPDLILTHHRGDFHQDHDVLATLSRNTFRDHTILEYEIPKYDGDLGRPNTFVPISDAVRERKTSAILRHFPSQQGKPWWTASTFDALMRLRGVECNAPSGYAEAFFAPKITLR
jgi:LmbE family N-acetylglucosaminyl deacetylase